MKLNNIFRFVLLPVSISISTLAYTETNRNDVLSIFENKIDNINVGGINDACDLENLVLKDIQQPAMKEGDVTISQNYLDTLNQD
jgi:hypothetical protein